MAAFAIQVALPSSAAAQTPGFQGWKADRDTDPHTSVSVKVETRNDGVDLHMSVQRTIPNGRGRDESRAQPAGPPQAPPPAEAAPSYGAGPGASTGVGAASAAPAWSPTGPAAVSSGVGAPELPPAPPGPRIWNEGNTIHQENPDGTQATMVPLYAPVWSSDGSTLTLQQVRQSPNEGAYSLYSGGNFQGVVWRPMPDPTVPQQNPAPLPADQRPGGGGGLDPMSVALDIEAHIPLPDIKIRTNPGVGLVALPSWYWVEGYRGERFGESRTITLPPANPNDPNDHGVSYTVEVSVWGNRYDWSFGDGKGATTRSLGRPYPAESDIKHTYEHSSLPFADGFPVRLTVEFAADFRVNGAGPFGLPPIQRTYEAAHRVQEIQPVLIAR